MRNFHELKVWEKAHNLTLSVYRATSGFPAEERFGLTAQIRRAAASVGANIAEGCGKGTEPEFGRYLQIALGSASELEYHLLLAKDLGFLPDCSLEEERRALKRMLTRFLQAINERQPVRNEEFAESKA